MREGVALRRPSPFSRRFGVFLPSPKSPAASASFPNVARLRAAHRPKPALRHSAARSSGRGPRSFIPPPDRDAPSAERFQLPALLCDCRLRRNSSTSRPQSFGTSPRSPPRLLASATSTPCAAEFPPLSLRRPALQPPLRICRAPPQATFSSTFRPQHGPRRPQRSPQRCGTAFNALPHQTPDPPRGCGPATPPGPAAKFPWPLGKISPDTRRNPPGPSSFFSPSAQQQKRRVSPPREKRAAKSDIRPGGRRPSQTIARPSARSRSPRRNAWRRACAQTVRPASSPDAPRLRGSRRASSPPQSACP